MGTPRRWTRLDHDERREQILAAARRLFSARPPGDVSTTDIAREAGVARGLLHHYFGTKRGLYLEVIRSMLRFSALPEPDAAGDAPAVLSTAIDRWLTMVERNRGAWLAAHGAQGLGRDPEVEALLEHSRELAVDRLVAVLRPELVPAPGDAPGADAPGMTAGGAAIRGRPSPEPASATGRDRPGGSELRALLRAYAGFAEAASLEWLVRGRLDRPQVHQLLLSSLLTLVDAVLPGVERARPRTPTSTEA